MYLAVICGMSKISVMNQPVVSETVKQIQDDLYCVHCAYNLRTLLTVGKCPECGFSVADSLDKNWLRNADPAWLKRMGLGATCVMAWLILAFICELFYLSPLNTLAEVLAFGGVWLLTSPREQSILMGESQVLRKVIRILYSAGLAGSLVISLAIFPGFPAMDSIADAVAGPLLVNMLVSFILLLVYLQRFALQTPESALTWLTMVAVGGLLACGGILGFIFLLAVLLGRTNKGWDTGTPLGAIVGLLLPLVMFGFAVLWIWSVVLFGMYRGKFRSILKNR